MRILCWHASGFITESVIRLRGASEKFEYLLDRREIWELFEVALPELTPRLLIQAGNATRPQAAATAAKGT